MSKKSKDNSKIQLADQVRDLENQIRQLKDADALNEILFDISNAVNKCSLSFNFSFTILN